MNSSSLHPLHACWDLAASAVRAEALDTALDLGLFEELLQPSTAAQLAARRGLHAANTAHLLELLWSIGLLQRQPGEPARYELAPVAREHLARPSPRFCGDAWRYRLASLRSLSGRLRQHVEKGPRLTDSPFQSATGAGWASAARAQIGQEQRAVSAAAALAILERLPQAAQARRLLDLGGGPGWIAIALAQRFAQLEGVVFDWPETAAVAHENIEVAGLGGRLQALGGDIAADPLPTGFDLVWCSSVLHFVPEVAATLDKLMAAMVPGGWLVCVHAELSAEAEHAACVMPFYLPMRLAGRHVLAQGGTAAALAAAGFSDIEQSTSGLFPMAPVQVVVARKPAAPAQAQACHV